MENNFQDWLRSTGGSWTSSPLEGKTGSVQELVEVHGLLEDAIKVADAVAHYLEDRERVARCETL